MKIQIEKMLLDHIKLINLDDFDDFWNENMLKEELLSSTSFYIIAKYEDEIVGFAGINFVIDEAHIANIVVKKNKRKLGIGSLLLENLISNAQTLCKTITLEVNEQNIRCYTFI